MSAEDGIEPGLVEDLLALQTREQRVEFLRRAGLLDAGGLDRLLDAADRLLNEDPGKAQRLAELCGGLADEAKAAAAVPRADYIRAGAHNLNGEFERDLRLTESAHDGYIALGMNLEALRTNVGKMAALLELGRYQEALDAGQTVLDALNGGGDPDVSPTSREFDLLTALVHQNRGRCFEQMGRYRETLDVYAAAEKHYRRLGMKERLGEIFDNRGTILSYLGRGNEALASHETAAAIFDKAGLTLSHAMSLSNVGETHLWLGNYTSSLRAFERAQRLLSPSEARAEQYFILHKTADTYLALNLYSEALVSYQEVDSLLECTGMTQDRAQTLWGKGSALIALSELKEAEGALDEATRLFSTAYNVPMLSGVMLEQAALLEAQNEHEAALTTAHRALDLVSKDDWPVQQLYARLRLADLLLPDVGEAEPHLLAARRLADRLALPQLRYRLNERLGHLRRLQGREEEARALLEAAVDEIERLRGVVSHDAIRASFMRDKTAAYEDLLLLHLARDDEENVRGAFAVAERAKSRSLVDLITGFGEKEPVRSADPEMGSRIRALQADLNAVYGELLGGPGVEERPSPLPDLHARAVELEQEISRLRLQIAAADPTRDPFAASALPDDVQDLLPSDTTLVAYHALGDEILAFVSVEGRIRVVRGLSTVTGVNQLLRRLDVQLDRFRAGQAFAERHMAKMERSTRQVLAALYDGLIAPLESLLGGAASRVSDGSDRISQLAIVPHGPLHRVPFHALFDGERYLIESFEISSAPSATVYSLCQKRSSWDREGAAVFGVEDPSIPSAAAEARTVAGHLPGAKVRVGGDATIGSLRGDASESGALHLACHGLFRSDNPMFSALKLHDGWLTAADAMSLNLPDALVTLSACESGRGEVIGGDEILGLTRAFLGAGAATLVVSLWLAQDEATAELMGEFYARLRDGAGPAQALRDAQLELKERYAHPYYWAPFVLIGKR
ncbi:CHAT domain-containing protein [Rubrobacter tropicus]|uniref:CHAT domain-containing protein n=1 Tax=Rubrobacter tropicus TaxID=2653851 RepID=A0A6G8QF19_9ACTN|nr:CHAT domain-containing tetratricopeptide repeat protein [Rubrobacter tropicus]QIN84837.1 CHAT domain-containing protein [Rubrobacter tropicus]